MNEQKHLDAMEPVYFKTPNGIVRVFMKMNGELCISDNMLKSDARLLVLPEGEGAVYIRLVRKDTL